MRERSGLRDRRTTQKSAKKSATSDSQRQPFQNLPPKQTLIEVQNQDDWRATGSQGIADYWQFLSSPAWQAWKSATPSAQGSENDPELLKLLKHGDDMARWNASGHDYRIDVARALWRIDPSQSAKLVPELIAEVESHHGAVGAGESVEYNFYSAVELLGEMGIEAEEAIPALRENLRGYAKFGVSWFGSWSVRPDCHQFSTCSRLGWRGFDF